MTAPFQVGSAAVFLSPDPEGLRAERTVVTAIKPEGDGWSVQTLVGSGHVDSRGEGSYVVPLDAELAAEFEEQRGTWFIVEATGGDRTHDLEPTHEQHRAHDLAHELDQNRGHGHER